jgi:hypothetical protein
LSAETAKASAINSERIPNPASEWTYHDRVSEKPKFATDLPAGTQYVYEKWSVGSGDKMIKFEIHYYKPPIGDPVQVKIVMGWTTGVP